MSQLSASILAMVCAITQPQRKETKNERQTKPAIICDRSNCSIVIPLPKKNEDILMDRYLKAHGKLVLA